MTGVKPMRFGDDGQAATRELVTGFERGADRWFGGGERAAEVRRHLATLEAIDRQYGGHAKVALEDAEDVVAAIHAELARAESDLRRTASPNDLEEIAFLAIGVALWAMRHDVAITFVEPVANALAVRSNGARTREDLAAVFGLMQGVIEHVRPRLEADLERSNPQRPWRVLHANLAITAIRTEDPAMIDYAFDALDATLPDERASFYAEATALALAPRIAPVVRERIEARHLKWTSESKS